jgi:autotransporter passenger strand-loop-strand repeat protein
VGSGGLEYVSAGGAASASVVTKYGMEDIFGRTIGLAVSAGGSATVGSGGVASGTVIAGGTLIVASGGGLGAGTAFAGTGGRLVLDSSVLPTASISAFVTGDTIQLAGIKYVAGATVSVAAAGVVTINDGGKAYKLNIANAAVGETDFMFSSGSLLTKSSSPDVTRRANGADYAALFSGGVAAEVKPAGDVLPAAVGSGAVAAPAFAGRDWLARDHAISVLPPDRVTATIWPSAL